MMNLSVLPYYLFRFFLCSTDSDYRHSIQQSEIRKNQDGALQYKAVGETTPSLYVEHCWMGENGYPILNLTSPPSIDISLQSTINFRFSHNQVSTFNFETSWMEQRCICWHLNGSNQTEIKTCVSCQTICLTILSHLFYYYIIILFIRTILSLVNHSSSSRQIVHLFVSNHSSHSVKPSISLYQTIHLILSNHPFHLVKQSISACAITAEVIIFLRFWLFSLNNTLHNKFVSLKFQASTRIFILTLLFLLLHFFLFYHPQSFLCSNYLVT